MPNYNLGKIADSPCDTVNAISELQNENEKLQIFPNPTQDEINIKSDFKIKTASIYDVLGVRVYNIEKCNSSQINFSIRNFSSGVYFVEIKTEKGIQRKKFIKG